MMGTVTDWVGLRLSGDRYEVTSRLGMGGMGYVYRARDNNLQMDVVIKAPRPELIGTSDVAQRFAAEIRSLVQLQHPHIVRIIDVGTYYNVPFAVMQFLSGGSLEDRTRNPDGQGFHELPTENLKDWLSSLAEALDFIHRMNYVHRDVKPANILFDAHDNAYLGDFGVVKAAQALAEEADAAESRRGGRLTRPGMVLGTPEFMAPEVIKGEPYGPSADQYSLAVTVYEVLTGRLPFDGATAAAILMKQMQTTPVPPHELRTDIPRSAGEAILRALTPRPESRFPNCDLFAQAVLDPLDPATAKVRKTGSGVFGAVLVAARMLGSLSIEEMLQEIKNWSGRWGARIIEASPRAVKLRFDVRAGWFHRLLQKEEYYLVDLGFIPITPSERSGARFTPTTLNHLTKVRFAISYQGVRGSSTLELNEHAKKIQEMLMSSLLLVHESGPNNQNLGLTGIQTGVYRANPGLSSIQPSANSLPANPPLSPSPFAFPNRPSPSPSPGSGPNLNPGSGHVAHGGAFSSQDPPTTPFQSVTPIVSHNRDVAPPVRTDPVSSAVPFPVPFSGKFASEPVTGAESDSGAFPRAFAEGYETRPINVLPIDRFPNLPPNIANLRPPEDHPANPPSPLDSARIPIASNPAPGPFSGFVAGAPPFPIPPFPTSPPAPAPFAAPAPAPAPAPSVPPPPPAPTADRHAVIPYVQEPTTIQKITDVNPTRSSENAADAGSLQGGAKITVMIQGAERNESLDCVVVRVSRKGMNLISPKRLHTCDIMVRLRPDDEPIAGRVIHCLPREDRNYQVGIIINNPPVDLTGMFGHIR